MPRSAPSIAIRRATRDDAVRISELYRKVWSQYLDRFPPELMESRMPSARQVEASMDENEYYLAVCGGVIAGTVRLQFPHGTCHLDRMVVHPEYRGKGIGRALTQFAINLAREREASKVWLDTSPELREAVALYLAVGFKECGHFRKHYWGEDIKFYEYLL